MIGYYIVEYEQHGSDRAKYGDRLLKRLAEKVNKRGINETLLQICRKFYTAYPQIYAYLIGEISATPSHKFVKISPTPNLFVSTYMLSLPNKETLQNFLLAEMNNV